MIAVDTNILVYAHRQESPEHGRALARLTRLAENKASWGIPVFCLGEFIRVVTHTRIFDPPTRLNVAIEALQGLHASPSLTILCPGSDYWQIYGACLLDGDARGNLAFDAQIAAVCKEHGVSALITTDRDFARFTGLRLMTLAQEED